MADPLPILALAEARLPIDPDGGVTAPIALTVMPDELVLLELPTAARIALLADVVCGCLAPREGRVAFLGRDWREEPPERADALRGRIGRLFGAEPWLPWLTVADNVLLAPLYHTRLPRATLQAEAARLARIFGLPGLPLGFPETLGPDDRARAALVRAFLGQPRLVVLENPTDPPLGTEIMPGLLAEIRAVRDRGGAVLWLTHRPGVVADRSLPATQRWSLRGQRLAPLTARAA
jgi:phospholipid/cholesterol/gamma-HCH transport system ATP-binding protein